MGSIRHEEGTRALLLRQYASETPLKNQEEYPVWVRQLFFGSQAETKARLVAIADWLIIREVTDEESLDDSRHASAMRGISPYSPLQYVA